MQLKEESGFGFHLFFSFEIYLFIFTRRNVRLSCIFFVYSLLLVNTKICHHLQITDKQILGIHFSSSEFPHMFFFSTERILQILIIYWPLSLYKYARTLTKCTHAQILIYIYIYIYIYTKETSHTRAHTHTHTHTHTYIYIYIYISGYSLWCRI